MGPHEIEKLLRCQEQQHSDKMAPSDERTFLSITHLIESISKICKDFFLKKAQISKENNKIENMSCKSKEKDFKRENSDG